MVTSIKKSIAIVVIASMVLMPLATMMSTDSASAVSKAAVNKMAKKSKNGFKKFKGKWYYIKGKKVVKGLKKISGKYYYFNKIGTMQTGAKKISGKNYYFKAVNSGKKKGQAPALANNVLTKSGKTWFYNSKGVRYEYRYKSVGNAKGNIAAGLVISGAKITNKQTKDVQLRKAYNYILNKCKYGMVPGLKLVPNYNSKTWKYEYALSMVQKKKGRCFGYAGITYVSAKALGYNSTLTVGKTFETNTSTSDSVTLEPHAWVTVKEDGKEFLLDTQLGDNRADSADDFFKYEIERDSGGGFSVTIGDKVYDYNKGKNY